MAVRPTPVVPENPLLGSPSRTPFRKGFVQFGRSGCPPAKITFLRAGLFLFGGRRAGTAHLPSVPPRLPFWCPQRQKYKGNRERNCESNSMHVQYCRWAEIYGGETLAAISTPFAVILSLFSCDDCVGISSASFL